MADSNRNWLAKKMLEEHGIQYRTAWDIYIKFYTVFLTFNVIGLGFTVQQLPTDKRLPIAVAFCVQNTLSAVTSIYVAAFSRSTKRQSIALARFLAASDEGHDQDAEIPSVLTEPLIPGGMGVWGGLANAGGHLALIACWTAILWL